MVQMERKRSGLRVRWNREVDMSQKIVGYFSMMVLLWGSAWAQNWQPIDGKWTDKNKKLTTRCVSNKKCLLRGRLLRCKSRNQTGWLKTALYRGAGRSLSSVREETICCLLTSSVSAYHAYKREQLRSYRASSPQALYVFHR